MNYLSACVVANFIRIMTFADAHLAWMQFHKVTMEQFVMCVIKQSTSFRVLQMCFRVYIITGSLEFKYSQSLTFSFLVIRSLVIGIPVFPKKISVNVCVYALDDITEEQILVITQKQECYPWVYVCCVFPKKRIKIKNVKILWIRPSVQLTSVRMTSRHDILIQPTKSSKSLLYKLWVLETRFYTCNYNEYEVYGKKLFFQPSH